ncbi:MAG: hypothetical protein DI626_00635 [Micavibrio aeruginosavorus]|uniref:UrcA family protein n=1 Tax=Micavibrio aeruginosavorus TaxID=349221 RepID=A0A2W5C434_9BACT|nr:MAG: hypothetical protein DI626_00635 [Micavibrio aeruginosavorus]
MGMRKLTLMALAVLFLPSYANADDVVIVQPNNNQGQVIELPGNAYVNTGNGSAVIVRDNRNTHDRIVDHMLGNNYRPYPGVPVQDMNAVCGGAQSARELRRCQKDVLDAQRDLYMKYND